MSQIETTDRYWVCLTRNGLFYSVEKIVIDNSIADGFYYCTDIDRNIPLFTDHIDTEIKNALDDGLTIEVLGYEPFFEIMDTYHDIHLSQDTLDYAMGMIL